MHFWCTFDALLMHFWCTFGALLMHFWCTFKLDALLMHFWCTFDAFLIHFDALLMHFWCTFDALFKSASKVHQKCIKFKSASKVHQKCIKFKSASKVHQKCINSASKVYNQFWYSSSKFLQNLTASSWMLAATKLDQEDMKSVSISFLNKSSRTQQRFLTFHPNLLKYLWGKNIKNSPTRYHNYCQLRENEDVRAKT